MRAQTWTDLPRLIKDGLLDIYVPGGVAAALIKPRSAIVGRPHGDRILVDFEGGLHGSETHRTFSGRLVSAAGRHITRYPTVARAAYPPEALIRVGLYDSAGERIERIDAPGVLAHWLAPESIPANGPYAPNDERVFHRVLAYAAIVPESTQLAQFGRHAPAMVGRHHGVIEDFDRIAESYDALGLPGGAADARHVRDWVDAAMTAIFRRTVGGKD